MTSSEPVPVPAPAATPVQRRESPTLLAPGFRFHPTDEELVTYYLKRKVSGRPLLVDAIGELDLYRCEPWDLPARSRLRSGDREWYFFTHLDRKYSGRSRTSRTTAHGYWKTTGKDRPVANRGSEVGMKKTLVFHDGRAPNGKRTNWVMHEYRLLDPVPQYAVCRVFEKNGTGPQNGAQYGAPFKEEEWDQDVELDLLQLAPSHEGSYEHGEDTRHDYLQMTDFMENVANPQRNTSQITNGTVVQNVVGQTDEPAILLEDFLFEQHLVNEVEGYIDMPEVQDLSPTSGVEEVHVMGKNDGSPSQKGDYVELNDIFDSEKFFELPNNISVEGSHNCYTNLFYADESSVVPEHSNEELFGDVNCNPEQIELLHGDANFMQNDNIFLHNDANVLQNSLPEYDNLHDFSDRYPYVQSTVDDVAYFDAPSNDLEQENFTQANGFLCSDISVTPEFDMVDELMAFFDTSDDNWTYPTLDSLEKFGSNDSNHFDTSSFAQVDIVKSHTLKASAQVSGEDICFPSSVGLPALANKSNDREDIASSLPDIPRNDECNKSLSKRLVDMLGSIPSPPGLASESPVKQVNQFLHYSAADSRNSIEVSAGMIHISASTVSKHRSSQMNGSMEARKMDGGFLSLIFSGWSYVLFISTLLVASYRVCVCFSSR